MQKSTLDKITVLLAECIGTALLVLLGCVGCTSGLGHTRGHFESTLNFGLTVMIVVQIFGCVSGSHVNPAVTVAAFVYKMVSLPMAAAYICSQILGAFIGFGVLKLIVPSYLFGSDAHKEGICTTVPHEDLTAFQAVAAEFFATLVLILVCCGVWDPRNKTNEDSIPLRFGFTVGSLAIGFGTLTGCSMNPARSFAPAVWNNNYRLHWIYWVGPLAAGVIGSVLYRTVFRREVVVNNRVEELPLRDNKNSA
uniref:Putative channel n=1 Tax=Corethrella appendiculata TaxID=1370023 RepID=U5ESK6_9DIPT